MSLNFSKIVSFQRNPDDYLAKKFVKEEEERQFRHHRRSLDSTPDSLRRRSANTTPESYKRRSHVDYGAEATQAAREYRQKRRSLNFDPSKEGYSPSSPSRKYQDIKSHYSPSALKNRSKSEGKLNKSPERSPKKSPAPLPPLHSHSKNSPPNKNSSRTSPKSGKEKIRAAKSEPNLSNSKLEVAASSRISNEQSEAISPNISRDVRVTSDSKSLVEINDKSEPNNKASSPGNSPTRPSVKKSRAPAPPSPASISPQPLSPTSNLQQSLLPNQTKNTFNQHFTEAVIENRSAAAAFKNGPLSTSSPLLSPTSTITPPISPSDAPAPVAPPRRKKEQRKNSVKSPSSPNAPLNGELKLQTKKEEHNISQDSLEFNNESTGKKDSRSLEDQPLKAERPNTLFTNSNYNNLEQLSPLLKEITDTLEMNENKRETSPQRPIRRDSSTKKKAAPQPPGVKQETSFEEDTNLSWENPPQTNKNYKSTKPAVVIEESSKSFESNGIHDQDDNKMTVGLKPRNTFDRMSISSYDSVDSIPPPLPSSAPPTLLASAPPVDDEQISPEEVIEVEYTVPHQMSIQESDDEDHNKQNHLNASRYDEIEGNPNDLDSTADFLSDHNHFNISHNKHSSASRNNNHHEQDYHSQPPPPNRTFSDNEQACRNISEKRSDFMGIKRKNRKYSDRVVVTEASSKIKIRNGFKVDESDESDTSTDDDDQNGFSATFSPALI
ncbi:hypothetical protein LOTGIDRAFT_165883 [Lottia gigantea]|uniref:Uncharacterized protein n=1 Tax=Lottia gigantea TaxID=225164 RepID=V3ZAX5_LOTGI|nr:hypothetical protein LOTGIDRAFT_165883 [Lottia gigantea]ESO88143.1 hypothetical protein LOTGIDRAFT_165883 [Lottia gigantea]